MHRTVDFFLHKDARPPEYLWGCLALDASGDCIKITECVYTSKSYLFVFQSLLCSELSFAAYAESNLRYHVNFKSHSEIQWRTALA